MRQRRELALGGPLALDLVVEFGPLLLDFGVVADHRVLALVDRESGLSEFNALDGADGPTDVDLVAGHEVLVAQQVHSCDHVGDDTRERIGDTQREEAGRRAQRGRDLFEADDREEGEPHPEPEKQHHDGDDELTIDPGFVGERSFQREREAVFDNFHDRCGDNEEDEPRENARECRRDVGREFVQRLGHDREERVYGPRLEEE